MYVNVPAVSKVCVKLSSFFSKSLSKSANMTLWDALSLFVHVTESPTFIVRMAGLKNDFQSEPDWPPAMSLRLSSYLERQSLQPNSYWSRLRCFRFGRAWWKDIRIRQASLRRQQTKRIFSSSLVTPSSDVRAILIEVHN